MYAQNGRLYSSETTNKFREDKIVNGENSEIFDINRYATSELDLPDIQGFTFPPLVATCGCSTLFGCGVSPFVVISFVKVIATTNGRGRPDFSTLSNYKLPRAFWFFDLGCMVTAF